MTTKFKCSKICTALLLHHKLNINTNGISANINKTASQIKSRKYSHHSRCYTFMLHARKSI